jgi:hypothetical protein
VHTFVSSSSAFGEEAATRREEGATSKPQTIITGIATIDIFETDFHCIETSLQLAFRLVWAQV